MSILYELIGVLVLLALVGLGLSKVVTFINSKKEKPDATK